MQAIFTFAKPVLNGVVASNRIADFISKELGIPVLWDQQIAQRWETLFIVGGAFAFCNALEHIAVAIEESKRVIWIQNDYTIIPPKPESRAESPFRKAFRIRKENNLSNMDYWTTIEKFSNMTPYSRYVNWNMLTYEPITDNEYEQIRKSAVDKVLYYGAFRKDRIRAFDTFFNMKEIKWFISGNSKFQERYPHLIIEEKLERTNFYKELAKYKSGLYIEDEKSHKEFHSPANRFYEMLSARLPMIFQREAFSSMRKANFDISPYTAINQNEFLKLLENSDQIRERQQESWTQDYRKILVENLHTAYALI